MGNISRFIDSTLLKAGAKNKDIEKLCEEALVSGFKAVIVNPYYVEMAYHILKKSATKVGSVIGFPLGGSLTSAKSYESLKVLEKGASEIDMVINLGALKSAEWNIVSRDISEIKNIMKNYKKDNDLILKVIIEISFLTQKEIEKICDIALGLNVDFVKTSTGFLGKGPTVKDVKMLNKLLRREVKIKASGGIKTLKKAQSMLNAGAERIGTSSARKIYKEWKESN